LWECHPARKKYQKDTLGDRLVTTPTTSSHIEENAEGDVIALNVSYWRRAILFIFGGGTFWKNEEPSEESAHSRLE
jgi:hypothetical protein